MARFLTHVDMRGSDSEGCLCCFIGACCVAHLFFSGCKGLVEGCHAVCRVVSLSSVIMLEADLAVALVHYRASVLQDDCLLCCCTICFFTVCILA